MWCGAWRWKAGVGPHSLHTAEPSASCLGDNCQSSAEPVPVVSSQLRLGGDSGQCGLVGCSRAWWNDCENDHQGKQRHAEPGLIQPLALGAGPLGVSGSCRACPEAAAGMCGHRPMGEVESGSWRAGGKRQSAAGGLSEAGDPADHLAQQTLRPRRLGGRRGVQRQHSAALVSLESFERIQRAHPCHESRAHRCVNQRFCRSPATVDRQVMCSSLPALSERLGSSVILGQNTSLRVVTAHRYAEVCFCRSVASVRGELRRSDVEPVRRVAGTDALAEGFIAIVLRRRVRPCGQRNRAQ